MTIGTATFHPNGRYAFPRSYVYGINIGRYGDTITAVDNVYTIHAVPPDPSVAIFVVDNRFWLWTSNRWTLDHIVAEAYVLVNNLPPKLPLDFTLSWVFDHTRHRAILQIEWFVTLPDFQYFALPAPPSNYWLPPPLS
jgi:hypothetical protein